MGFNFIKTIYLKELLDTIRDKRTLYVMVLVPIILMPVLMFGLPLLGEKEAKKAEESAIVVAVRGQENAPELVDMLKKDPKVQIDAPEGATEKLENGDIQLIMNIPAGFSEAIKKENSTGIELKFDSTQRLSELARFKIGELVNGYSQLVVGERLKARGVSQTLLTPLKIDEKNVASEEKQGGFMLSFIIPMMLVIWAVTGGMYTAIDVAAGEKERGTLEALLMTPPGRSAIVLGKYFAILTVSMVTIILALTSMLLSFKFLQPSFLSEAGSVKINLPPLSLVLIFGLSLMLTSFIAGLQLSLSAFARSFKEAQNYLTPLYLVIILPVTALQMLQAFEPPLYLFAVPVINVLLVFKELFLGQPNWPHVGLVAASTLVFIAASIGFAINTFNKETVLFRT